MKKIYTLLFSTLIFGSAFAQQGQRNQPISKTSNDVYGFGHEKFDRNDNKVYVFTPRERDQQIASINREIDYKIKTLNGKFFWSRYEKMKQIKLLEELRGSRIQLVLQHFNNPRNQFGDQRKRRDFRW